jgi:hypothetical protein
LAVKANTVGERRAVLTYIAKRAAGVRAWFGRTLEETTVIELKV